MSAKFKSVWSLLEMLEFDAKNFVASINSLYVLETILPPQGSIQNPIIREEFEKQVVMLHNIVLNAGMPSTADALEHLRRDLKLGFASGAFIKQQIVDMRRRMQDDLKRVYFFSVDRHKSKLVPTAPQFGDEVNDNFLSAAPDIEEAGKCLALDRGTACVFHLMRVLERGVRALANTLNVPITNDNWNSILTDIENEIRRRKSRGANPDWSPEDEIFFADTTTSFFVFKNAWRNYTLHKPVMYDPEKASEIYTAVRSFMKHIAQRIKE
jgi:hypothetical protein